MRDAERSRQIPIDEAELEAWLAETLNLPTEMPRLLLDPQTESLRRLMQNMRETLVPIEPSPNFVRDLGHSLTVLASQQPVSFRKRYGRVIVFGLATVVFGLSTSFGLSLAALAVMGAGDMVSVYIGHLRVQLETPDDIRGRVSAVHAVFIGASNELGEFESGVTAAWFGAVPAVIVGGCATLVVAAVWSRRFPELWRLDRFPGAKP